MTELSQREEQILRLRAVGEPAKAIAADLGLSPKTVEFHLAQMNRKHGIKTMAHAAHYGIVKLGVPLMFAMVLLCLTGFAQVPVPQVALVTNLPTVADASLAWDRSPSTNVAGYKVYYGKATRTYSSSVNVGNVTNCTLPGLSVTNQWFIAATAYDVNGSESDFSNEVIWPPVARTNRLITITPQFAASTAGPWSPVPNWPAIALTNPVGPPRYYRIAVLATNF